MNCSFVTAIFIETHLNSNRSKGGKNGTRAFIPCGACEDNDISCSSS